MKAITPATEGQYVRAWTARLPRDVSAVQAFFFAFTYFLASQYFCTSTFLYNAGFYGVLLPLFFYAVWKDSGLVNTLPRAAGTIGLLIFFGYVMLHAVLWRYADQRLAHTLSDTLINALFVLMALVAFRADEAQPERMIRVLVPVVLVCALISISVFFYHGVGLQADGILVRLIPIGRAHNPITGSDVYSVVALMAAYRLLAPPMMPRRPWLDSACVAVVMAMVLLSQSRGPLVALGISLGLMLILFRKGGIILAGCVALAAVAGDVLYYTQHGTSVFAAGHVYDLVLHSFNNRDSARMGIWGKTLGLIAQKPWQGYGMQAKFSLEGAIGAVNPHNLYLATAYYAGLPAMLLLLLPLLAAFYAALRHIAEPRNKLALVLLVHGVVATLTNFGQPVKAASPLWMVYWLPVAFALAYRPQKVSVGQA